MPTQETVTPSPIYLLSYTISPAPIFHLLDAHIGGDVEINPGPGAKSTLPCGYCELAVNWSQKGICCDDCSLWFHKTCVDISSGEYDRLSNIQVGWKCFRCNTTNSSCRFHSYEVNVYNPFETLSYSPDDSVFSHSMRSVRSIDSAFVPPVHSSPQLHSVSTSTHLQSQGTPIRPSGSSTSSLHGAPLPGKKHNMRTLIINANCVSDKRALLENVV